MGVTMRFGKPWFISLLLLGMFLSALPGMREARGEDVITFSGFIDSLSSDGKYIAVNETKVSISKAKILNERGTELRLSDLRRDLRVKIEGLDTPSAFVANKITVIRNPNSLKSGF